MNHQSSAAESNRFAEPAAENEVDMAIVRYTKHLVRFFPDLANHSELQVPGKTVAEVINNLDETYAGLAAYIVDERGALRKHVNIFRGEELIHDRQTLQDPVADNERLFIFQALSGGSDYLTNRPPDDQTTRPPNYQTTRLPDYQTTRLPNYQTI